MRKHPIIILQFLYHMCRVCLINSTFTWLLIDGNFSVNLMTELVSLSPRKSLLQSPTVFPAIEKTAPSMTPLALHTTNLQPKHLSSLCFSSSSLDQTWNLFTKKRHQRADLNSVGILLVLQDFLLNGALYLGLFFGL